MIWKQTLEVTSDPNVKPENRTRGEEGLFVHVCVHVSLFLCEVHMLV